MRLHFHDPNDHGAAKATGLVLPEVLGHIDGMSIRVPTADVSLLIWLLKSIRTLLKGKI
ncbi:MAG: hypothetical protein CM1200mP14_23710 [Gammaproteobacteria bacterium]|nr:MAG: hypothetical protein CM1200mP14_23710 [Gammaproteobacteria bacterium]